MTFQGFGAIHEFIVRARFRSDLLGEISKAEVSAFHADLEEFGPGKDGQARASEWAQKRKQELK